MRLVAGVLALTLCAPLTRADEAKPSDTADPPRSVSAAAVPALATTGSAATRGKVSLRVVRVMPDGRQALLFDRTRNTHVLAEVGQLVDGYVVEDIADDEVTLRREGRQIVLVAAAPASATATAATATASGPTATAAEGDALPIDPYAPAVRVVQAPGSTGAASTPVDEAGIQAGEGGVRVVRAPSHIAGPPPSDGSTPEIQPGEAGVRVAVAPGAPAASSEPAPLGNQPFPVEPYGPPLTAVAAGAPVDARTSDLQPHEAAPIATVSAATGLAVAPAPSTPTTAVASTTGVTGAAVLSRAEVNAALGNFAGLAGAIRASFSPSGLVVEAVADATIFHRAGLRAGDVVTSINGSPLRSLDDAATLYARVPTAKQLTAQILRSGKPMTLQIAIQ